jgi:sulfate transport system substrate-binding protein
VAAARRDRRHRTAPGTGQLAQDYLAWLYSDEAQEIAAQHALRPRSEAVLKKHADLFKPIKQFTVAKYFGSLSEAQKVHFNDGGQFDKIYVPGK